MNRSDNIETRISITGVNEVVSTIKTIEITFSNNTKIMKEITEILSMNDVVLNIIQMMHLESQTIFARD